jgi:hypothetical protein
MPKSMIAMMKTNFIALSCVQFRKAAPLARAARQRLIRKKRK